MTISAATRSTRLWFALLATALLALSTPALAQENGAGTTWRLLDYIAVDYAGAVSGGKVTSASEYAEMQEFASSVDERLKGLPANPGKAKLLSASGSLQSAIAKKQTPEQVATIARGLGKALLEAYPVQLGPRKAPDLALGAHLYAQTCAACHGMSGKADTAMAKQLDPPPVAFANRERAAERSPFALYQVIDQGLEGTAMQSFSNLPPEQKWALAFYVSRFAYPEPLQAQGKRIWEADPQLRSRISNLDTLAGLSEEALGKQIGDAKAAAVLGYLRSHPQAVTSTGASALSIARQKLQQSFAAYEAGDRDRAKELALAAYLDGFEPVEAVLGARDGSLVARVESKMGDLRSAIAAGKPADDVHARMNSLNALFDEAEAALAPDRATAASTFLGAFTILFREGLEALLIVVGMLAFLRKGDRPEMIRPVHVGWISALVAGGLTWVAATTLISVSGASRELTEGFGSLLAAAVLLFVGIWMHGKAQADEWHRYIKKKVGQALSRKSAWFLFLLAFVAVYREVFETILFYAAMAAQEHVEALVAGAVSGAVALAIIAVVMLKFSQRLPIGKFFAYSSALVAVLAVVLAGKGVAALQESGLVAVTPLASLPRIPVLGLFPTLQGITIQLLTLIILALGFGWNQWEARRVATAT
ncbi:MAG TPA: cytochrome c/FTR1 family iron permease [Sphingomicrobium sp.]|jgi:high-affinity iron transporter|nr:cytochrome c/FTR1 family iron permease [Sphingomicrobium sp.]